MTAEQQKRLHDARNSLAAAQLLLTSGYPGYAASRAYYAMFYIAEAFLEGQEFSFSKHSAVIAAFGRHLVRTGKVPADFHKFLITAQELRHSADYGHEEVVTLDQARQQIDRAEQFLVLAEQLFASSPPANGESKVEE